MAKKETAAAVMQQAGVAGVATFSLVLKSCRMAVREKIATTEFRGADAGKAELGKLTAWAKDVLKDTPNAYATIAKYVRMAATVALCPKVIGKITTGTPGKETVTEVDSAHIKTRRELAACATAAGPMVGAKPKSGGRGPSEDAKLTKAEKAKKAAEAHKAAKLAEGASVKAAKANALELTSIIRSAFDGKHGAHRQTIVDALAACGFKLAPIDAKGKAAKPATKPVKGLAAKPKADKTAQPQA